MLFLFLVGIVLYRNVRQPQHSHRSSETFQFRAEIRVHVGTIKTYLTPSYYDQQSVSLAA